jgi:hypothetical protein
VNLLSKSTPPLQLAAWIQVRTGSSLACRVDYDYDGTRTSMRGGVIARSLSTAPEPSNYLARVGVNSWVDDFDDCLHAGRPRSADSDRCRAAPTRGNVHPGERHGRPDPDAKRLDGRPAKYHSDGWDSQ